MGLFELIVVARCGEAKGSANLLKQLAIKAFKQGGNIRDMKVLGDRILSKQVKGQDGRKHIVGRYLQVLYDGNLECKQELENTAKSSYETIRLQTHRVKDFYNDALYYQKQYTPPTLVQNQTHKKNEFQSTLFELAKQKSQK